MKGIDIAWARPDTTGILATGAKWVARYFSGDPTKNLTADEVKAYVAAGLAVVTVWESTANRAGQGFAAGANDAKAAIAQRTAVGLPSDHVIYFAVDFDAQWADVKAYFDGVCSVLNKSLVGVYGGYKIMVGADAYGIGFLWQTTAWSNGIWYAKVDIRQVGGTVLNGGADVDDATSADFGQYPQPPTSTPTEPFVISPEDRQILVNDMMYWLAAAFTGTYPGDPNKLPAVDKASIDTIHAVIKSMQK